MSFEMPEKNQRRTILNRTKKTVVKIESNDNNEVKENNNSDLLPESEKDMSFLKQDEESLKEIQEKSPHSIPLWEDEAKIKTLQTLNTLRMLSPVINKAMLQSEDQQEQATFFTELMKHSRYLSFKTGVILGADNKDKKDRWMFNVLDRVFAESLSTPFDSIENIEDKVVKLAHAIVNVAEEGLSEKKEFIVFDKDVAIKIALMKAMTPVMIQQEKFSFRRNIDDDIVNMSELIFNSTVKSLLELVDPFAKESERVVLFQILADISGNALSSFWEMVANEFKEELKQKSVAEIQFLENAHPNGYSLTKVLEKHESFMRRLVGLTKTLKLPAKKKN